jgi:hypothetical protein
MHDKIKKKPNYYRDNIDGAKAFDECRGDSRVRMLLDKKVSQRLANVISLTLDATGL